MVSFFEIQPTSEPQFTTDSSRVHDIKSSPNGKHLSATQPKQLIVFIKIPVFERQFFR
jgi:hypothetical protein